jgi:hypothetical protein
MRLRGSAAILTVVGLSLVAASGRTQAREIQQGRDFAGFYDVADPYDDSTNVWFELTVEIWNFSGGDIIAAIVALKDSILPGEPLHQFYQVDVSSRDCVRLSGDVHVPKREYESWLKGATPRLEVRFSNSLGQAMRRPVELVRMPLGEGE